VKLSLLFPVVIACLALSACVEPPTPEEIKSAHYGSYPSNYRSALDPLLDSRHEQMGDPFEVVSISKPQKDWMGDTSGRTWGYSVEVVYKAPNPEVNAPMFIYREKFFFVNRKVVAATNETSVGDMISASLQNNLNAAAQQTNGGDAQQ
jgi:hypothetical protein